MSMPLLLKSGANANDSQCPNVDQSCLPTAVTFFSALAKGMFYWSGLTKIAKKVFFLCFGGLFSAVRIPRLPSITAKGH
jgi:hypothetical protein